MQVVTVRIKQRPDEDLEVTEHEARVLKGQGLLVEDEAPREGGEQEAFAALDDVIERVGDKLNEKGA